MITASLRKNWRREMIKLLKVIASFLFYFIWDIVLLDCMILVLVGCLFVTKTALEELFGCSFTRFTKKGN